jgi:hypothetical protein
LAATLATNLNPTTLNLASALGAFEGGASNADLAGWLGDVSSIKVAPNMGDDYKADLDAVNISERLKSTNASLDSTMQEYYAELDAGETNRATEFKSHISVSEVIKKVNKVEGVGQQTSETPKTDEYDYDAEQLLNKEAKKFVDSLKDNSNSLSFGFGV